MNYEAMRAENTSVNVQISKLQRVLRNLPEGEIICTRNGKYSKWYVKKGGKRIYLDKNNRALAEKLARKKYYSAELKRLQQEKYLNEWLAKHYNAKLAFAPEELFASPAYSDLLSSNMKSRSHRLQEWIDTPYEKSREHPEHLIHKALPGLMVRSKSEAMIASALFRHNIPFRYECMLNLGETYFYPDFTIMHPKTGKIYYWEHHGLMDNAGYIHNTCAKLEIYANNNIIPSVNLIQTFETSKHPLTPEAIEKIINDLLEAE